MEFKFCLQDPTDPNTRYLYEAIIGAVAEASTWRGIYAFGSRAGVNHLFEDPVVHAFMDSGGATDLLVGIDAVTNRQTLERLQQLEARHPTFRPRVFWNEDSGLFHPKLSHFSFPDGRKTLILGSGNLTPGGLMHNFEAYNVITANPDEAIDLSSLDAFLAKHAANIRTIDEEALELAARNLVRPIERVGPAARPVRPRVAPARIRAPAAAPGAAVLNRVLIAQVPAAGGRWAQVHFNAAVVEQYFRITDRTVQRVYLTHVDSRGNRGDEEVRPCVYSERNKNHKIEIGAARGEEYPPNDHPILVFRERQARSFDYMLLMPGAAGYARIARLSEGLPSIGRGFRRVITDFATLARAWPECPLLSERAGVEKQI